MGQIFLKITQNLGSTEENFYDKFDNTNIHKKITSKNNHKVSQRTKLNCRGKFCMNYSAFYCLYIMTSTNQ